MPYALKLIKINNLALYLTRIQVLTIIYFLSIIDSDYYSYFQKMAVLTITIITRGCESKQAHSRCQSHQQNRIIFGNDYIQYFGQFLDSDNLSRYNMLILLDITSWLSTD
jgi:hypothetical protein